MGASTVSLSPQQRLDELLLAYRATVMLHVAAELGIADQLSTGSHSVEELAQTCGSHPDFLYRVLRTLTGFGVFHEEDGRRFRLTPMAELLRSGVSGSYRVMARIYGHESFWRPYGMLLESVKTGKTSFDIVFGENHFEWLSKHEQEARTFDAFQGEMTRRSAGAVVSAYDFGGARTVVDVGGGAGDLLWAVLGKHQAAKGILFDLDHVANAARTGADAPMHLRCDFVGGDFFKAVPAGGDVYLLKYILHDWDDNRTRAILRNCRRAMRSEGRLLVIEELVCGLNEPCRAKLNDIAMMAMTGGRNRTEAEYRTLLEQSGFAVKRVIPAGPALHIMEALLAG